MTTSGASRLARTILTNVRQRLAKPDDLELGTIEADGSLRLDHFAVPIPPGEYLVSRWLSGYDQLEVTIKETAVTVKEAASHTHETEPHTHEVIVKTPVLQPGDRVLVAWVNGGAEPIVLDVVVNSDAAAFSGMG